MNLDRKTLNKIGECYLEYVLDEARTVIRSQTHTKGDPIGLPEDPAFLRSFKFKINGQSIEIYSEWPTIAQYMEGTDPYPMRWLTQESDVKVVPMKDSGMTVFRTTPKKTKDAWVHPGFAKHDFIVRGIAEASDKVREIMIEYGLSQYRKKGFL